MRKLLALNFFLIFENLFELFDFSVMEEKSRRAAGAPYRLRRNCVKPILAHKNFGQGLCHALTGLDDGVIPDPGRCPGLVCRAFRANPNMPICLICLICCPCKVRVKSV